MAGPKPVVSPYGFTSEDHRTVSDRKADKATLYVVLGYQFESKHYNSEALRKNVRAMFDRALNYYNKTQDTGIELTFKGLRAGYGSHLFNAIARDIVSADIAVFDTSDLNPNVMLEFGVALTWGTLVLPIRAKGCPQPPSDVSGHTWTVYRESAAIFEDPDHRDTLGKLVELAVRTKSRP